MSTDAQLLNFDGVSVRTDNLRFDLLDASDNIIGETHPEYGKAKIANSSNAGIKRKLTGVEFPASEAVDINPLAHRLRPVLTLENGSEYPLGTFLFSDTSVRRYSYGLPRSASLSDKGQILDQPLFRSLSFAQGALVTACMATVCDLYGITNYSFDSSNATLGSVVGWPAGKSNTGAKILDFLASIAGLYSPYFTNAGVLRARAVPDLSVATTDLAYLGSGVGTRIVAGSMVESNDILSAPNLYVVVDNSATKGAVVGEYRVPDTAPHSIAQRGYVIPRFIEASGVGNEEQAISFAQAAAAQEVKAYETVSWSSPLDPRHETFDVVNYLGTLYVEIGWSISLAPGGPMDHTAQRVYL